MKVRIEFNCENKELAKAIGMGLVYYGDPLAAQVARDLADKTTPAKATPAREYVENADIATLEEWIAKYGEPVDPSDWAKVPDRLIPSKEVFPGVDENAVADAIGKAGQAEPVDKTEPLPDDAGAELIPPGPVELDEHGVPFDAAYCAKSDKPFYATGKRVGQWKKKRGTDQDEYDIWYDENRPPELEPEPGKVDTAAAFAGPGATGEAGAVTATTDLPSTPGDLMKWCAEQTAAGAMTTEQVTAAYAACGITVADMFGADGPTHVQAVLAVLVK